MKLSRTIVLVSWALTLGAADKPATETETLAAKLKTTEQELRLSRLENLVRREEAAVQQVEQIRKDQQALYAETCKAAGIDPDPKVCTIDLNTKTVTRKESKGEAK